VSPRRPPRREPWPDEPARPLHRVGDDLERLVRDLAGVAPVSMHGVFDRWEEAVGPAVAAHARPVSLEAGRLVVAVDEPGWATQLRYLGADLLARLAQVAGEGAVTSVEVRVKPAAPHRPNR